MNRLSPTRHLGMLAVLLPGLVGLLIVGQTLARYWPRDRVASVIVGAMGAALLIGIVELLMRQAAAARLSYEVAQLPASPSEATLDGASAPLSALLRARVEQTGAVTLGDSIAPYLTGLLVMLGLLGTLLGLFETVHGASRALIGSADVDSLRRSLTTPIEGLTRSFGCSAAGIGASAMLGLAVALVRRRESRLLRAVNVYAVGPLRALSPLRRQARALEQLAAQGGALPQAAGVLEQVGTQLAELSTRLSGAQDAALEAQGEALGSLLTGLREELGRVAADAGQALQHQLAPVLSASILRSGEALTQQSEALGEATRALTRQLTEEAEARRAEASALIASLGERIDAAERARSEAHARELALLTDLAMRTLRELEMREQDVAARAQTFTTQLADAAGALREGEAASRARIDALAERVGGELSQLAEALSQQATAQREREAAQEVRSVESLERLAASAALLEAGCQRQGSTVDALVARVPTLLSELAETTQRGAQGAIAQLVAQAGVQLGTLTEAQRSATTQLIAHTEGQLTTLGDAQRAAIDQLIASTGTQLSALTDTQREAVTQLVAQAGTQLGTLGQAQREAIEQLVMQIGTQLSALTDAQREGVGALVARADTQLSTLTDTQRGALEQLVSHADTRLTTLSDAQHETLTRLAAALRADDERAQTARADLDARAREAHEHVTASAALLEESMARQGEVMEALVGRVGGLFETHASATRESVAATLDALHARGVQQAERFAQLEQTLVTARSEHALHLSQALSGHARALEEKLGGASAVVQEAAGTWQVASAEMQAVAELFARSIDRQREASDAWLESLGEIEGAVEQAGRGAAADALADQLASTQEVFARQLQFQRELFEELRSLRGATSRAGSSHGEHDVSV